MTAERAVRWLFYGFLGVCAAAADAWWISAPAAVWLVAAAIRERDEEGFRKQLASLGRTVAALGAEEDRRRTVLDRYVVRVAALSADLVEDLASYDSALAGHRAAQFNEAFNDWRREAEREDPERA